MQTFQISIHGVHSLFVLVSAATDTSWNTFSKKSEAYGLKVCNFTSMSVWNLI
jgi:hypothetical protein